MYDAGRARLCGWSVTRTRVITEERTHLANGVEHVLLVGDVTRVKWDVVVSLNDVEGGNDIAASNEVLDDVSTDETTSTDDEVDVLVLGRHVARERMSGSRTTSYSQLSRARGFLDRYN